MAIGKGAVFQKRSPHMASAIRQLLITAACIVVFSGIAAAQPSRITGATCSAPPRMDCPGANCPSDLVRAEGNAVEPKSGRKYFLGKARGAQ
jgi:hypothetical protein